VHEILQNTTCLVAKSVFVLANYQFGIYQFNCGFTTGIYVRFFSTSLTSLHQCDLLDSYLFRYWDQSLDC